jgi:spermidine/putrescine transport system permease protein
MNSTQFLRFVLGAYIVLFFGYLFGPLILMSITAFNSSEFPRITPWDCFTIDWFVVLTEDKRIMTGLRNSIIIGIGVVCLSVPIGLAAAIMLTQVGRRMKSVFYTIVVSPILVPGVVLGISTLIFWDRLGTMFDANYNSVFYNGIFLSILGQSTFVSAYCMLVFTARLQRFDPVQEEAALDLGATNVQAFFKILLPFLKPAMGSAAVMAFLASFENYNTTIFTIVSESTLTTVLASKVRFGINPSISALAVIIVVLTLICAIIHEAMKRQEARSAAAARDERAVADYASVGRFATSPWAVVLLIFLAGLGTLWLATRYDTGTCKMKLQEERQLRNEQSLPAAPATSSPAATPDATAPAASSDTPASAPAPAPADKPYQGIFAPQNLEPAAPKDDEGN